MMPEMRHDPIQRRWVVIAKGRALRPTDFTTVEEKPPDPAKNPFSEGNEGLTPKEVAAFRPGGGKPDSPGWLVRVVPNKYPALRIEGNPDRRGVGLYDEMNGVGAHEIVIETPDADLDISLLPPDHATALGGIYRDRLIDLMRDRRFRYVLVFKNHGRDAGASLAHPHSQIVALPVTPLVISLELESARSHFNLKERCLFCDIIAQELSDRERIVLETERFVAFCPYASRFPYEIWLLPRYHQHDFREIAPEDLAAFMAALQEVLQRLKAVLKNPPYNFMLHTAPNTESFSPRANHWQTLRYDWHWHLEIIPRVSQVAGFEWGTGLFINSTPPELAAEILRDVAL